MDEQTNLGFTLRARILPHIEGSDELKQSVEQLAQNIQHRMQQTTLSPAFTEGISASLSIFPVWGICRKFSSLRKDNKKF